MSGTLDLKKQVEALTWVHQIDLGNGVVTPGRWPQHPQILRAFDTIDFRGKKVLDIGCWDGLWSFEAEKRGASTVYAIDDITQRSYQELPTFVLAHKALRSSVRYFPNINVYDIEKLGETDFDVVLFCGVFYHLKNPLLALSKLRYITKEGGSIVVEGAVIPGNQDVMARFYYSSVCTGDPSNWWVPTIPCLQEWIECSFFEVQGTFSDDPQPSPLAQGRAVLRRALERDRFDIARCVVTGRAVRRKDPNYVFVDRDLAPFDLNGY